MIDPRRQHRPSRPQAPQVQEQPDPAEVMGLLLEIAPLRELPWEPLLVRTEALLGALRGEEGCTRNQVDQLRRWAANWGSLLPVLRAFYQEIAPTPAGEAAIWCLLDGTPCAGATRGQLHRLWTEKHGFPPNIAILPAPLQPCPPSQVRTS